ncbi:MAG: polysaccharide biosynthesis/export family protein [Alphaproteobacteria bacterium]|jgi:polysaccharide export outer membrane protein|nr:polysaccharide biosynthesis/export family protein [Alphaproteobacteria bacterium]MDP6816492.1 polysaccharide biosynthesis/export family protein [Alphaproteobacteria bacterium]
MRRNLPGIVLALVLALGVAALPHMTAAQNPTGQQLQVDEDELLELESFETDEPIPDINAEPEEEAGATADGGADSAADSAADSEATAVAVRDELIDPTGLQEYRLGPGDRLSVVVFGQDDLSGELAVDGQGRISMPLIGQVQAQNRTVNELQQIVTDMLSDEYLIDPRISVEVTNYRPFYIYGQVNKPGSYPYVSGMTVRQAIALAGGYTRRASEEPVSITRTTPDELLDLEGYLKTVVLPGDTIRHDRSVSQAVLGL